MFHCLPNVRETQIPPTIFLTNPCHSWGGGRPFPKLPHCKISTSYQGSTHLYPHLYPVCHHHMCVTWICQGLCPSLPSRASREPFLGLPWPRLAFLTLPWPSWTCLAPAWHLPDRQDILQSRYWIPEQRRTKQTDASAYL